jgi:hypothetical protein
LVFLDCRMIFLPFQPVLETDTCFYWTSLTFVRWALRVKR